MDIPKFVNRSSLDEDKLNSHRSNLSSKLSKHNKTTTEQK